MIDFEAIPHPEKACDDSGKEWLHLNRNLPQLEIKIETEKKVNGRMVENAAKNEEQQGKKSFVRKTG